MEIIAKGGNLKNFKEEKGIVKLSAFIVDKRNLFFLIFAVLMIFSVFSQNWVKVENSLSAYLPKGSETRVGLDLMEKNFETLGTADIMVSNITYEQAQEINKTINSSEGVALNEFSNTTSHYANDSALYSVTFFYGEEDERSVKCLNKLKSSLKNYDTYVSSELGDSLNETIASEMKVIVIFVSFVIVAVLTLTSGTYAEVPVLLLTFISAALINKGTNFLFGTISFVSNSVTVVLQLALSVDYAIIFCNRFKEEKRMNSTRDACVYALSKSFKEISASSLTTVGGLAAMIFMRFGIGRDMGVILIKAIIISLLSVFFLMPGLLMLFSKAMEKTTHKNFIPDVSFIGKFDYKFIKIIPLVFFTVLAVGFVFSIKCNFVYSYSSLKTPKLNSYQVANNMINDTFGTKNKLAVVIPSGNYKKEKMLTEEIKNSSEVDSVSAICDIDASPDYKLSEALNPRQFSEFCGVDYDKITLAYAAYAIKNKDYSKVVNGISAYKIPLIDILLFVDEQVEEGYVSADARTKEKLGDAVKKIGIAKSQLQSEKYSRIIIYLNVPEEGKKTFNFLDKLHTMSDKYYGKGESLVVGNASCRYDLQNSFSNDNKVVSAVSVLIVLVVLLFTFKSVGMPLLLILIIQGSIWLNFAIPAMFSSDVFFMSYLIVSAIQMGANIDYAIVISSRYNEERKHSDKKEALIKSLNASFPTVLTSGVMLSVSSIIIGSFTSEVTIAGIGKSLGRGTVISLVLVLFVLPELLCIFEKIMSKTSFEIKKKTSEIKSKGKVKLDGMVNGYVSGNIKGIVHAEIEGEVNVITGSKKK